MTPVALYLRSSKDRAEVSISAQRRELQAYAKGKGYSVVAEFEDVELSGSLDETNRPGLRAMLAALVEPDRRWQRVLCLDTSRLARDQMISLYVARECDRQSVGVEFAKSPVDGSTAFGELFLTMSRAIDRLHARISAEKGKQGLIENFHAGHRSGGAAPMGYKLKHTETGNTRGGVDVKKSTLVVDPIEAPKVRLFLQRRAAGEQRATTAREVGLGDVPDTTLLGIERNALCYAGYSVWNQRVKLRPTRDDPRKGMRWRPRAEWLISAEPVHEALITRDEADTILAELDSRKFKSGRIPGVAQRPESFLLSSIMATPEGTTWQGDGAFYRLGGKGKRVSRTKIETRVLDLIRAELSSKPFVASAIAQAHAMADKLTVDPKATAATLREVEARIGRVADAIAGSGGSPTLLAKLASLEGQADALRKEAASAAERAKLAASLRRVRPQDIDAMLEFFPTTPQADAGHVRRAIESVVERVVLDSEATTVAVHYRLNVGAKARRGAKLASPAGFEPAYLP